MVDRRNLLKAGLAAGALGLLPDLLRHGAVAQTVTAGAGPYGPLLPPDANGFQLPEGFGSRVLARSLQPVAGTTYPWHAFPDGGATYATADGGWIYTSNSEVPAVQGGGVSALRFTADGEIADAYRILSGTRMNCAGGRTPWGTWLSCEEVRDGLVYECNPFEPSNGVAKPALGLFSHEAATVDPIRRQIYLTEDAPDGRFYRFTPASWPEGVPGTSAALDAGQLEAAGVAEDGAVAWHPVASPATPQSGVRLPETTPFNGGEGIWWDAGRVYFTTKGDQRVWLYDTIREHLAVLYDGRTFPDAPLTGVDNVVVSAAGDIIVAEDGGNMELVIISAERVITPLLRLTGQDGSELTGPAFSPDGTRLYVSSQRGGEGGLRGLTPNNAFAQGVGPGMTYEITGPFRRGRRAPDRGQQHTVNPHTGRAPWPRGRPRPAS